jgi:hypothetical protein
MDGFERQAFFIISLFIFVISFMIQPIALNAWMNDARQFEEGMILAQNDDKEKDTGDASSEKKEVAKIKSIPLMLLSVDSNANTKDLFVGMSIGLCPLKNHPLYAKLFFSARPYKMTRFVERSTNSYYQFKEERYVFGIGLDEVIWITDLFGLFLFGGGGYTSGNFAGTDYESEREYLLTGGGGLFAAFWNGHVTLRLGYQYIRIPDVPSNRAYVAMTLFLF